ncbi:MAG: DUF2884 family protein [Rhodanobacter sp.]
MRSWLFLIAVLSLLLASPLHAQDLASTCHATSSYDMTLRADSILFDRASPAPMRVELQHGSLHTDGNLVRLDPEQQDRLTLFQRDLRVLVPRARAVAQNGVDMAVQALRAEAADLDLSSATRTELDRRLHAQASELKQRIARSQSTHDWQGDAMQQYASQVAADLTPLVAADLGQQAIDAALSGDLQAAASLRDRAGSLATDLQPRLQRRMQALRPQIEALCPAIQRLARLQKGLRDSRGQPLDLVRIRTGAN